MPNKLTNRHTPLEKSGISAFSAARANDVSTRVCAGVDATRAASLSAHGTVSSEASNVGDVSPTLSGPVGCDDLAQTVDSAALEIKAILGRMRQLALQAESHTMNSQDRQALQDDFSMLASEIDRVAIFTQRAQQAKAGLTPDQTLGLPGIADDDAGVFTDEFIARLTASSLGVAIDQASVICPEEAEWAIFRIDTAEIEVTRIRDEFGTVEERMDSALAALDDFIHTHFPNAKRFGPPTEIVNAAERMRLQRMHQDGVSTICRAEELQKSVIALLQ